MGDAALSAMAMAQTNGKYLQSHNCHFALTEMEPGKEHIRDTGIRCIESDSPPCSAIAAPLPHDLEAGGLRRLAGIRERDIRDSSFREMCKLFSDDPELGPSFQTQLFFYAGMGALAALPEPLSSLIDDPYYFRVVCGTALPGLDSLGRWLMPGSTRSFVAPSHDRFANCLASSLSSHGGALISTVLAPAYKRHRGACIPTASQMPDGCEYGNVPQSTAVSVGACSSSLIAFCAAASDLLLDYPGFQRPRIVLLTAADAALQHHYRIIHAFGTGAVMTEEKLAGLNVGREGNDVRQVGDCLAPFDADAQGTVIGNGGSGLLITTLDFAVRNLLDVTSIIVGWGHSQEASGKAHFAGVGFGGERALMQALDMAYQAHGCTLDDFHYYAAHGTGTRANARSELQNVRLARQGAADRQGFRSRLPPLTVGTSKAVGDGHTMGETGLKSLGQALQYVLGQPAPGLPTLRTLDAELQQVAEDYVFAQKPAISHGDAGSLCAVQGFGGYNGAVALRSATRETLGRYIFEPGLLERYLERWDELRSERERREMRIRLSPGISLTMAEFHHW
ncbi:hypothetical protein [Paraburkholderia kururiensis]|uniref:hypothetical protein n=1 Tax=Paraburkholderia kururiensis TaxID=984307 RepID=UPI0039A71054